MGFQQDQFHARTSCRFKAGAQEIEFVFRFDDDQAGGLHAEQCQSLSTGDCPQRPARHLYENDCAVRAESALAQREGEGCRLIACTRVNFVQASGSEDGKNAIVCLWEASDGPFPQFEELGGHGPNQSMCSLYVP